ncbi:MAG: biopolymer transporter ExbD [Zetaproteobacteria bacterium]|nr:biopolymer transporter ExbD [Zetaproteobacteria bacterium]
MASVGNDDGEQISLNIMPMLDIFSILILFLLMSFSTDPVSHDLNGSVELPESDTLNSLDEVPTVAITRKELIVNDKTIAPINAGELPKKYISQGAVYDVFKELEKLAEANKKFVKKENKKNASTLTIEIDKGHSFKLIKSIMVSAQQAEFVVFKMMVSKSRG